MRPAAGETVSSYLRRLALANLMDPGTLRTLVTGDDRKAARARPAVLSRLSGRPEHALQRALTSPAPGRRPGSVPRGTRTQAACSATPHGAPRDARGCGTPPKTCSTCAAASGTTGLDGTGQQPGLADQPEILAAHRACRRLARAHGHEAARRAYLQASWVIETWRESGCYDYTATDGFNQRMRRFLGPGWCVHIDSPIAAAAKYPQVVALTRLLASPYWTDLATRDHIAAGRPDRERSMLAAAAVLEYRRKAVAAGHELPDPATLAHLAAEIAAGYLLADGPGLRTFVGEVRRTVEPSYTWSPLPRKFPA